MRRWIATLMSMVLLVISSLPLLSVAEACPLPAHIAYQAAHDTGTVMDMHVSDRADSVAMNHDMQDCRIECACGCHQNLDSLPHQLAPHVLGGQSDACAGTAHVQISRYTVFLYELTLRVELPPPDLG